jgi:hypothetical protein
MTGFIGKWLPEEDEKLLRAAENTGNNWVAMAALVPNRTKRQCINQSPSRNRLHNKVVDTPVDGTNGPREKKSTLTGTNGKWTAE